MKYLAVLVILACLAIPAFAQNTTFAQRLSTLSDSMGTTITKDTATLAEFDSQIKDNGDFKTYASFKRKYEFVAKELDDTGLKVNLMIRSNDRTAYIKAERDNYEDLLKQLQSVKSDFDNFSKSVR